MINTERILGSLVRDAMGGGRRGRRGRRRRSAMFGVGAGALGLGALGLAFAAVEHWSKQKTESGRASAAGVPPPPPPGSSGTVSSGNVPLPPLPTLPAEDPPPAPPAGQADSGQAMLLIRAMIAASNADHDIDDEERGRILTALEELGDDDRDFLLAELETPLDLAALTAQVSTKEMAREVYLASLMAIDVDTPAEIRYLARLAERMGLDDHAVAELEATLEDD